MFVTVYDQLEVKDFVIPSYSRRRYIVYSTKWYTLPGHVKNVHSGYMVQRLIWDHAPNVYIFHSRNFHMSWLCILYDFVQKGLMICD